MLTLRTLWDSSMGEEKLSLQKTAACQGSATFISSPASRAEQVAQRQTLPCLGWQQSTSSWHNSFSQPCSEKQVKNTLCATERPRQSSEAASNALLH